MDRVKQLTAFNNLRQKYNIPYPFLKEEQIKILL